jgi:hypothetical protein
MSTDSTRSTRPWLVRGRARYETSFAHGVISRLIALDFTNQAFLLGAGLLISLLPFLIFISAFADERIDDDLELHLGLDHHAAQIVSHLFRQGALSFNAATLVSLIFAVLGTLAVVTSLQEIYEKVFDQSHRGIAGYSPNRHLGSRDVRSRRSRGRDRRPSPRPSRGGSCLRNSLPSRFSRHLFGGR